MNSETPRLDSQDAEFFRLLTELFGPGCLANLLVNFSYFAHSEDAVTRRTRQVKTVDSLKSSVIKFIMEFQGENPRDFTKHAFSNERFFTIDALHDRHVEKQHQHEMELLWSTLSSLATFPVGNLEYVESKIEQVRRLCHEESEKQKLAELEIAKIRTDIENSKGQFEAEKVEIDRKFQVEKQLQEAERAKIEETLEKNLQNLNLQRVEIEKNNSELKTNMQKELEKLQEKLTHAAETEKLELLRLKAQQENKFERQFQESLEKLKQIEASKTKIQTQAASEKAKFDKKLQQYDQFQREKLEKLAQHSEQIQRQFLQNLQSQQRQIEENNSQARNLQNQMTALIAQLDRQTEPKSFLQTVLTPIVDIASAFGGVFGGVFGKGLAEKMLKKL